VVFDAYLIGFVPIEKLQFLVTMWILGGRVLNQSFLEFLIIPDSNRRLLNEIREFFHMEFVVCEFSVCANARVMTLKKN